jgi:N-acetylmuramoyl-L-alanine amidase
MWDFPPDSPAAHAVLPSPNHDRRVGTGRPDMLVLHYTGMADGEAALAKLCEPTSKVSAHYVVFEDGRTVQCVPELRRAWHAGVSSWEGQSDVNSRAVGIEIVNPGHDFGYPDFPEPQVAAVIRLARDILRRHPIHSARVVGHSDVAPARKRDPGEKFPWPRLHAEGIGLWIHPAPLDGAGGLAEGDAGAAVEELQAMLATFGYGVTRSGRFDADTRFAVAALQRHFRPARIDGIADASTIDTLRRVVAACRERNRRVEL